MAHNGLHRLARVAHKYYIYNKLSVPKIRDRLENCRIKILDPDGYPEWINSMKYDLGVIIEYSGNRPFFVMLDPASDQYNNKRIYSIKAVLKKYTNVDSLYIIRYGPDVRAKHIIRCLIRILKDRFLKKNCTKRTYSVI